MDALIKKAEELGRLLAGHERFEGLMAARDAVRADTESAELLKTYETQVQKMQQMAAENKPIEVADKHNLAEMEQTLAGIGLEPIWDPQI